MTWTAGQREFTPLLLGLYHLLPPRNRIKQPDIEWVVIEEPEMGLHPQAITVVMLLVLDLLWRGYRSRSRPIPLTYHHLAFGNDGRVRSADISDLDPGSEDERVAGWGGLTEFSSRFGDAVRKAVNESE